MGKLGYVGLLGLLIAACGSDVDGKPSAGTGSGGTGADAGSTNSSGGGTDATGTGGTREGSGGASSTDDSGATTTDGGGGGTSITAVALNGAADCWEPWDVTNGSNTFDKVDQGCSFQDGDGVSVRIDAEGQCWIFWGTCELEGLSVDDRCGEPQREDEPPRCGEGGAAGEASAGG
jgi:hypothetical protein